MSTTARQVNLKLTPNHEEIVRDMVNRLRSGGPSFEKLVREFLLNGYEPKYMHVDELDLRFGHVERRLIELEVRMSELCARMEGETDLRKRA
jgi:hypothetical protein